MCIKSYLSSNAVFSLLMLNLMVTKLKTGNLKWYIHIRFLNEARTSPVRMS